MKKYGSIIEWIFSILLLFLVAQLISSFFVGENSYADILRVLVWLSAFCLVFPPIRTYISKSQYANYFVWASGIIIVTSIVLPYVRIAWFQQQGIQSQEADIVFREVTTAANKYCREKGYCAASLEDLVFEGYLPLEENTTIDEKNSTTASRYSRITYSRIGNTTCLVSLELESSFGPPVSETERCSSRYLF